MRSCTMPKLTRHLVQELTVGTLSVLHLSVFLAGALASDRYPLASNFRQICIWSLLLGSRFISIVFICIVHENSFFLLFNG